MNQPPRHAFLLPAIVFSQFAGTSLWFAGNAVLGDLRLAGDGDARELQWITQAVQLGFICGTLLFALFAVADRASPRLVFLLSSLAGALANLAGAYVAQDVVALMALRFCTGFFLAGIYPVGMKVAAGWYERGLGGALGLLVGALVLGTAFPHLLQALSAAGWLDSGGGPERARSILAMVSLLAVVGGATLYALVPDGPYLPRRNASTGTADTADAGARTNLSSEASSASQTTTTPAPTIFTVFRDAAFLRAALGYFGHMWELYAFWAFTPIFLAAIFAKDAPLNAFNAGDALGASDANISLWSFLVIAVGFFGCAFGGYLSLRAGSARVAFVQLAISGGLCLLSPLFFLEIVPLPVALAGMLLWGVVVIGDSPQFSALVAATAPRELVGSALTIVNSIGFALTIVSIELLGWWAQGIAEPAWLFVALAPGPIVGLLALRGILRDSG